ncbi:MAG: hypothetical protein K9K82_00500 [Desulfobacteraceae bacterium]|nr:hypothetical protein [Desulfobacteraceae bacterium]
MAGTVPPERILMQESGHIYAVITGDFIGFSDLDLEVRRSMPRAMAQAAHFVRTVLPGVMSKDIAVFRGDSWQALLDDPVYALRIALIIRARILSSLGDSLPDTRMTIGVGPVDYVDEAQVSAGDGPAFRRSGKMLESMTYLRNSGLLRYCNPDVTHEYLVDALVRTAGALSGNWRPLQARAVLGILQGMNRAEIAENWPAPVSRQAISKHLKNACWAAALHGLEAFERIHGATL